ncbi:MAG TPA: hypothetical protein VG713_15550 [Pirellulales bacterium]|nr:hypothetical protein [Pirellulales bacterium]
MSRTLIGGLAAAAALWAGTATAAMHLVAAAPTFVAVTAAAPIDEDGPEMQRLKVTDLLGRSRKAMEQGNWDEAETLLNRAEAFKVTFPLMYFGETPKKVRRDLDKLRPAGKSRAMPSEQFAPHNPSDDEAVPKSRSNPIQPPAMTSESSTAPVESSLNDRTGIARQHLARGRAALAQGNMTGAAHWCEKAMQAGGQFFDTEDSPQKLANDIRHAGGKVGAPDASMPNSAANPRQAFAGESPFARPYADGPPASAAQAPTKLLERGSWPANTPATLAPPGEGAQAAAPSAAPSAGAGAARPSEAADPRSQSNAHLLAARKALAVGDTRRAMESLNQAKALGVKYEFHEDSPSKVEAAIQKYSDLLARAAEKDTEGYRRRYAELQMQQSEELLRWREFDEAERLAGEAKRHGIGYTPFESNPETLLKRIGDARRGNSGMKPESLPEIAAANLTGPKANTTPAGPDAAANADKARVLQIVGQARAALNAGDRDLAERLAHEAEAIGVPDSAFGPQDDRAWLVLLQLQKLRRNSAPTSAAANVSDARAVQPATAMIPVDNASPAAHPTSQALYTPQDDTTKTIPAAASQAVAPTTPRALNEGVVVSGQSVGAALFAQGEEALRRHDAKTALALFREAANHREELDPITQQKLQDHLQMASQQPTPLPAADPSLMTDAANQNLVKYRQVSDELNRQISLSKKLMETDPKQAYVVLEQARVVVEKSQLDTSNRDLLLRRVDRIIDELQKHIEMNKARIELDEHNRAVKNEIEREQQVKVEVQDKIAQLVDEFNDLMDQRRYAEAELKAKQAFEIAPKEPVVMQIMRQAKFVRATENNREIQEAKRDGFERMEEAIETSAIPWDDTGSSMQFGKNWKELSSTRLAALAREKNRRRSEREIEIEQRLKTPVSLQFKDAPLEEVMKHLAKLANVSIYLDPRGLAEEAVDTSTPVTIDLTHEISLKSALSLILEPLHLSYVIKDEVLKITSEQLRDGEVYPVTYNVADLVIPIPNFVPNGNLGLTGALRDAQAALNPGGPLGAGGMPLAAVATPDGSNANAMVDPKILAQVGGMPLTGFGMGGRGGGATGFPQQIGFGGPGGMGGGVQPDFNSLIELITGTIAPQTWSDVGGAGAVKEFAGNLSLVISQTQEVHEQISDLLEQLRRLQDLQVTIEVRFITLSDNFYEKMGVQFDMNLPTNIPNNVSTAAFTQSGAITTTNPGYSFSNGNSVTAGLSAPANPVAGFPAGTFPSFTTDLDVPFNQGSFSQTLPTSRLFNYAGVGASGGATLGFAILSDLEAYFFMEAVQNDVRTNVLQAPKVTLFNGQQAFVSDTTQSPFVISVIPVVGDFAAAQQPVIVVLSEGTFLTVQAVVSSDRRFVRLTVVPFFSQIGNVNTFTFTGSSNATRQSSSVGVENASTSRSDSAAQTTEGTTVQLPQFAFQTVTTTVSVPDGGTVLLGGIKRLTEERKENGVPILNKVPYLNRLFNNISTGRVSSSLMMMVTPRIIIQEEEEALLGVQPNAP